MTERYRINLVIPYLDGEYYGTIFTTLHREAIKRKAILFSIQALASVENPAAFEYQIGTDIADGWILVTSPQSVLPSSNKFLKAIEASKKPVITIGYQERSIACHSVMIDNRQAIKDAVLHLIHDHGHRRIAFVGGTEHADLIERFEGYKEALRESGLPFEPDLIFQTTNSLRQGGEVAARVMLDKGVDFTAVVAATDLNAMGLIEQLESTGYRVPHDIAVIGFDDLPSSQTFDPPLTSIHQSVADLARESIDLLYQMIEGEEPQQFVTYIPTEFKIRSSCGCSYEPKKMPIVIGLSSGLCSLTWIGSRSSMIH